MKRESLAFLADNPFYTKRFAFAVGRRCRAASIKSVAKELRLDWHTVKELEKQYMREQLRRAGTPGPKWLGIDEVSIRKGHTYRIVVSDLARHRPIWFGGTDRSEASLDLFYEWLRPPKSHRITLVVMDMWKAFRASTTAHAPQAAILFDKFHVMRHLGEALDTVRRSEYRRLSGQDRTFVKGQRYTLLARRAHLSLDGRQALQKLLAANQRLHTAYLLKESFDQVWGYRRAGWARRFFDAWTGLVAGARPCALREVRGHGGTQLGRHRGVLPRGGEGLLGVRGGFEHQDPRHPTSGLWSPRRGVSAPEGPYLHVAGDLNGSQSTHQGKFCVWIGVFCGGGARSRLLVGGHPSGTRRRLWLIRI